MRLASDIHPATPLTNPVLGEEGTVVLLDIGRRSTEILIVANGEPVFARAVVRTSF